MLKLFQVTHGFTAQNTYFHKNMLFTQRNMGVGLIIYNLDFFHFHDQKNKE